MRFMESATKKAKRNKKELLTIPKSAQDTIPYIQVYEEYGIIETRRGIFTKSYRLHDINYSVAKIAEQEQMILQYGEFLNSFDPSVKFQITINNRNINQENFENDILFQPRDDEFNYLRDEFNEKILKRKMTEGKNNLIKEKYLTVSISADSYEDSIAEFARLEGEMCANIKKIGGADTTTLTTVNRLEILHDIYNLGLEGTFASSFSFENMRMTGLTTKDYIAPNSFEFNSNHFRIGDKYGRALYLKMLPTSLRDTFVKELSDISCNMLLSINFEPVSNEDAIKLVRNQTVNINANVIKSQQRAFKNGYSPELISSDLKYSQAESEELMDAIVNKDQKMFFMTFVIVHFADDLPTLDRDTNTIEALARSRMCTIDTLNWQQENGLNSALPLANNRLSIKRTLITESAAVFMPFTSQEMQHKNGMYYGLNAVSRNLIMFNPQNSKNGNAFFLGTPGSGKSTIAKAEMINVLLNTDNDVIVIDPEAEYHPMAKLLGGQVVRIAAGGEAHVNPMDLDMDYGGGDDPITLKSDFLISFCETAFGDRYGLTATQKSILDRCCRSCYEPFLSTYDPKTNTYDNSKIPTLLDFQEKLDGMSGYDAMQLATSLEIYTRGSLNIFAHKTDVAYNNRFVVYDIKDIGSTLTSVGMLVILDNIWNRIMENRRRGKNTWFYIDEIYLLFKNTTSANFLRELYKRARKYGGYPRGITQNVSDVLENDIARTMISNCEFIVMLNQAPLDRANLAELLNISPTQLSHITNAPPGKGLIYTGSSIIPFENQIPKDTTLYRSMTTKLSELTDIQKSDENDGGV